MDITTSTLIKDIRTATGAIRLAEQKIVADLIILQRELDSLFRISSLFLETPEGSIDRAIVREFFVATVNIVAAILADIRDLLGAIDNLEEEIREDLLLIGITPPSV